MKKGILVSTLVLYISIFFMTLSLYETSINTSEKILWNAIVFHSNVFLSVFLFLFFIVKLNEKTYKLILNVMLCLLACALIFYLNSLPYYLFFIILPLVLIYNVFFIIFLFFQVRKTVKNSY